MSPLRVTQNLGKWRLRNTKKLGVQPDFEFIEQLLSKISLEFWKRWLWRREVGVVVVVVWWGEFGVDLVILKTPSLYIPDAPLNFISRSTFSIVGTCGQYRVPRSLPKWQCRCVFQCHICFPRDEPLIASNEQFHRYLCTQSPWFSSLHFWADMRIIDPSYYGSMVFYVWLFFSSSNTC